jgi:hypothetical protein
LSFEDACGVLAGAEPGKVHVLAFDQAARTGWCVHDGRRPVLHGVAATTLDAQRVLDQVAALPGWSWQRVLVAFEDHREINKRQRWSPDGKPERNPVTVAIGLGDARGGWRVLLDLRGQPASQRILVHPTDWHQVLRGLRFGAGDDWKSAAMRFAATVSNAPLTDDNEADAIVIATDAVARGLHAWATERLADRAKDRDKARAAAAAAAQRRPA